MPKSSEKNASRTGLDGVAAAPSVAAPAAPSPAVPVPAVAAPAVVGPSHRLNIAFPFSQIKLEEPSKELAELAALVFDLVGTMAEWVPEDRLEDLRARAKALRDTLR